MAIMSTDLSGVIRFGEYGIPGATRLAEGLEEALRQAASLCGAGGIHGPLIIPGMSDLPHGPYGVDARQAVIRAFADSLQHVLADGLP